MDAASHTDSNQRCDVIFCNLPSSVGTVPETLGWGGVREVEQGAGRGRWARCDGRMGGLVGVWGGGYRAPLTFVQMELEHSEVRQAPKLREWRGRSD